MVKVELMRKYTHGNHSVVITLMVSRVAFYAEQGIWPAVVDAEMVQRRAIWVRHVLTEHRLWGA
jgi:hypothetical protein